MNPSISMRNFAGGLLGGITGILLSYYINPLAIPFGVLFGMVLGWWHLEVVAILRNAHQRARTVTGGVVQVTGDAVMLLGRVSGLPPVFARFLRFVIAKAIVGSVAWAIAAPSRFYRWLNEHPMNRTNLLTGMFYVIWLFSGAPLGYIFGNTYFHFHDNSQGILFGIAGLIMTMGGAVSSLYRYGDTDLGHLRQYYREWEVMSHYGYIGLLAYLFGAYMRYTVGFGLFVTVAIGWAMPFSTVAFISVYFLVLAVGISRGLYLLASRTGHWMCFGTTLTVTGISWLYFHGMFENTAILWSIALVTGIVSGTATEVVRRTLNSFYENTAVGKWMSKEVWEHISPKDDHNDERGYLGYSFRIGGAFFRHNRMARLFRALCFDMPIARPVEIV